MFKWVCRLAPKEGMTEELVTRQWFVNQVFLVLDLGLVFWFGSLNSLECPYIKFCSGEPSGVGPTVNLLVSRSSFSPECLIELVNLTPA